MKSNLHAALDGTGPAPADRDEQARLREYREALDALEQTRVSAPSQLAARIMNELRETPARRWHFNWRDWLPAPQQWLLPAAAGAAVALLLAFGGLNLLHRRPPTVAVHFQLHAPNARQVELVGDFNQWQPGAIRLTGPDASGHWTATVALPEGRYEYQFLVDGRQWVTDPAALVMRPDGFGHLNAIREVTREGATL